VIHLSTEMHLGTRAIAKRMDISRQAVIDLLHKYHDLGSVRDRPRSGRKRKIREEEKKEIVKKAKRGKDAPVLAREFTEKTGIAISERTVQRTIRDTDLRYLTKEKVEELSEANIASRLDYAISMKEYNWKKVFFSDEKTFFLGSMKPRAWQVPGKRRKHFVKRHPKKLHVWAAAGAYMKSQLYFFSENMNALLYRKILKTRLDEKRITFSPDCPARMPQNWVFLQDNDPKHKAKKTMNFLQELVGDRIIAHPAQSPDLNILEDLWSYLDRKIKASKVKTINGLKRKLTMEWETMSWEVIRQSVRAMRARLVECEKLQGARTHY